MKKIIVIALCLLLLCGCTGKPTPTDPVEITTAPTVSTDATTQPTTAPAEDAFALAESCVGKSVDELVALIGEPDSKDYAASCLVEGGEDGNWYYDGFTVYTLKTDDGETVEFVE
jgi:hypothetical protein